jgi:hypothetical protein
MSSPLSSDYYIIRDTSNCISYEPSSFDLFLPSPIIFSKLCMSTDRTTLFIVSLTRMLFYTILYYVLNDLIDFEEYSVVKYLVLTIIIINIIYIGIVVSKSTVFSVGSQSSVAGSR